MRRKKKENPQRLHWRLSSTAGPRDYSKIYEPSYSAEYFSELAIVCFVNNQRCFGKCPCIDSLKRRTSQHGRQEHQGAFRSLQGVWELCYRRDNTQDLE